MQGVFAELEGHAVMTLTLLRGTRAMALWGWTSVCWRISTTQYMDIVGHGGGLPCGEDGKRGQETHGWRRAGSGKPG